MNERLTVVMKICIKKYSTLYIIITFMILFWPLFADSTAMPPDKIPITLSNLQFLVEGYCPKGNCLKESGGGASNESWIKVDALRFRRVFATAMNDRDFYIDDTGFGFSFKKVDGTVYEPSDPKCSSVKHYSFWVRLDRIIDMDGYSIFFRGKKVAEELLPWDGTSVQFEVKEKARKIYWKANRGEQGVSILVSYDDGNTWEMIHDPFHAGPKLESPFKISKLRHPDVPGRKPLLLFSGSRQMRLFWKVFRIGEGWVPAEIKVPGDVPRKNSILSK